MGNLFNSFSKIISEGYNNISEKAEEITKIGRIKLEIIATKRDIEKMFIELGGKFYVKFNSASIKEMKKDPDIIDLISKVKKSEEKLEVLKSRLDKLRKEEGVDLA